MTCFCLSNPTTLSDVIGKANERLDIAMSHREHVSILVPSVSHVHDNEQS